MLADHCGGLSGARALHQCPRRIKAAGRALCLSAFLSPVVGHGPPLPVPSQDPPWSTFSCLLSLPAGVLFN